MKYIDYDFSAWPTERQKKDKNSRDMGILITLVLFVFAFFVVTSVIAEPQPDTVLTVAGK